MRTATLERQNMFLARLKKVIIYSRQLLDRLLTAAFKLCRRYKLRLIGFVINKSDALFQFVSTAPPTKQVAIVTNH